jgi:tol-pal system protein YbgF
MISMARSWVPAGALAFALALSAAAVQAQQGPPGGRAQAKAPAAADAGLQRRVEQLEEQLVDLQVVIGTLESLAKGVTPPPAGGNGGFSSTDAVTATDAGRLDAIETQIRALAAQLESLQETVRGLARKTGANDEAAPRFGSVTVAPAPAKDDIDRLLNAPPAPPPGPPSHVALSPHGGNAGNEAPPQQLYEEAYGFLLQKNYGAAEAGFEEFLRRHPGHQLAGNAQYWLGETFYVRGQYRAAAGAFLKGYQTYNRSPKAPESLLKLAMSLHRLGQKDNACSSFTELATKYPNPPAHVKSMAQAERKRSGC